MRTEAVIAPFRGLWKREGATVPEGMAVNMLNALCVTEGDLRPRYGFRTLSGRPVGVTAFAPRGFAFLQGFSETFDALSEFVTIEKRDGVVRPYSVNLSTGARTAITNGGVALTLPDGMYQAAAYDSRSYWINPESNTPLYRHTIGSLTSWDTLVDTAYTPPPVNPVLTLNPVPPTTRNLSKGAGADTITVDSVDGLDMPATTATAAGVLEVTGSDNDNGVSHRTLTTVEFNAAESWSAHGYIGVEVVAGAVFPAFERTNLKLELKIGGAWVAADTKELFNSAQTRVLIMARIRGMAGIGAVQGLRFSVGGYVARNVTGTAYKVNPIKLCGSFMEAVDATKRLWDGADDGDGVEYAVRFCQAAGAGPVSAVTRNSVNQYAAAGDLLTEYGVRVGGRIAVSVAAQDGGTYTHVEILRQNQAKDKWFRIGLLANVDTARMTDVIEDYELVSPAYPEVAIGGSGTTQAKPPFSTRGVVACFSYRGRLCWLRRGGKDNVSMSRVGDPEETFDKNNVPSLLDTGRPVDFSMAPDLTDEPVGGVETGNGAILFGKQARYALTGVTAADMEPPAQIPGSTGVCGRFAFSKCIIKGQPGAASMDKSGTIWFDTVEGAFAGDASARPVDLTFDLWKWAKTFLYDEQRGEFGMLDLSSVWMTWDEFGQSLWVGAGRRALVLRVQAEDPQWEPYEYALVDPGGATTTAACLTAGAYGSAAVTLGDGVIAWTHLGNPFASDDQYAQTGSFGYGTLVISDTLRISALQAAQSLNPEATLTSVKLLIEHRKTGDLLVFLKSAKPRIAGVLGANLLGVPVSVPLTDSVVELPLIALPSVAQVNSGLLGGDFQYEQETWLPAWNDPSNWVLSVSAAGANPAMTVTANWVGVGPVPTKAFLNITSGVNATISVEGFAPVPNSITGMATLNNGQLLSGSGSVARGEPLGGGFYQDLYTLSNTVKTVVALVAGTGSVVLNRSGSGVITYASDGVVGAQVDIGYTGSVALAIPAPVEVRVDAVLVAPCYELVSSVQEKTEGIGWQFPVFTSNRQMMLFRSSGQIDEVEWNSQQGAHISGVNRDGGRPMPDCKWQGKMNVLERTRVKHVEIEGATDAALWVSVDSARREKEIGRRFTKWPITAQGFHQTVGVEFGESVDQIRAMRVEFEMLSKRYTQ